MPSRQPDLSISPQLALFIRRLPETLETPRICIAGKNDIAANCLLYLLRAGVPPAGICVVANRCDTGRHTWQRSLIATARQNGVAIWPVEEVKKLPDIRFFSLEHDRILRPKAFATPHLYNLHFSKLPAYRGVSTSVWPLINREKESAVTLHRIDEGIDTGTILAQRAFSLTEGMTAGELYAEYTRQGEALFQAEVASLLEGAPAGVAQDESAASYYSRAMIDYRDAGIDFQQPAEVIQARLRAFTFWQYQLPLVAGRRIWRVQILPDRSGLAPGAVKPEGDWHARAGTGTTDLLLEYCFLDALIAWAKGGPRPGSLPAVLPPLDLEDLNGWTALMVAAFHGNTEAASWLISAGATLGHQNRRGKTALMYAKSHAEISGNLQIVEALLNAGADTAARDEDGLTVLDYCDREKTPLLHKILSR
jgi:methionyl-tRNA formyltransferase